MSSSQTSWQKRALTGLIATVRNFPVEAVLVVIAASTLTVKIYSNEPSETTVAQVLSWAVLSFLASFGLTLMRRVGTIGQRNRLLLSGASVGFLAAVIFVFVDFGNETTAWRLATLGAGIVCALPLTLLGARADDHRSEPSDWRMTLTAMARSSTALIYVGAVMLAIGLAAAALHELFEIDIEEALPYIAVWLGVALAPMATAVWTVRDLCDHSPVDDITDTQMGSLARYLLLPALLTYLAIIYIYTGKIALTGEAPQNMLSPLALGAALLGVATIFLLEPMVRRQPDKLLSKWVRALPWLLLGALPLAGWAIWERIAQHGWTELRYARLLLVVGLATSFGWAAYQRHRNHKIATYTAPAVFAVLCALASFGPWSISEVSEASQQARLQLELRQAGISTSHPLTLAELESATIDEETRRSLVSRLDYLLRGHGDGSMAEIFEAPQHARDLLLHNAFVDDEKRPAVLSPQTIEARFDEAVGVAAGRMVEVTFGCCSDRSAPNVDVTHEGKGLQITEEGADPLFLDPRPLEAWAAAQASEPSEGDRLMRTSLPQHLARQEWARPDGRTGGVLVIRKARLERSDGQWRLDFFEGTLLLPTAE